MVGAIGVLLSVGSAPAQDAHRVLVEAESFAEKGVELPRVAGIARRRSSWTN